MPVKCTPPCLRNLVEKKNLHHWVIFYWVPEGQLCLLWVGLCTCGCWMSVNWGTCSSGFKVRHEHTHACSRCDCGSATKGPSSQTGNVREEHEPWRRVKLWANGYWRENTPQALPFTWMLVVGMQWQLCSKAYVNWAHVCCVLPHCRVWLKMKAHFHSGSEDSHCYAFLSV